MIQDHGFFGKLHESSYWNIPPPLLQPNMSAMFDDVQIKSALALLRRCLLKPLPPSLLHVASIIKSQDTIINSNQKIYLHQKLGYFVQSIFSNQSINQPMNQWTLSTCLLLRIVCTRIICPLLAPGGPMPGPGSVLIEASLICTSSEERGHTGLYPLYTDGDITYKQFSAKLIQYLLLINVNKTTSLPVMSRLVISWQQVTNN